MKRQNITPIVIAAISLFLVNLTFAALPRYEIIDLGTLDDSWDSSAARSINNFGQIVGLCLNSDAHIHRATLFDPSCAGNNINLGTLGGRDSWAWCINDSGQIVGMARKIVAGGSRSRATLFDPSGRGNNIDLGTLGGLNSEAFSVNKLGQIVGRAALPSISRNHAALFDVSGGGDNIGLGTLGGRDSTSLAWSINNSGQIVGLGMSRGPNPTVFRSAALFDPTGGGNNIDLGTLGGPDSDAFSINDAGQIVGWVEVIYGNKHRSRATLFDHSGAGNNINLDPFAGPDDSSWARSINNKGQIVGTIQLRGSNPRATLFDPSGAGNNIDLNTRTDPTSGWTLRYPYSINDSGWIVGSGINPNGQSRAFLLIPQPVIIYVDDDAAGANEGSSWADAYNYLQDALAAAYSGDEIYVAQGIYKPDQGAGITPGDREATFQLIKGVTLKGGYAGFGEPDPNARDIDACKTILTGDLNGNDVDVNEPADLLDEPTRRDNTYHVVTGSSTDPTAILSGFTITAGNANIRGFFQNKGDGGGIYNENGSPMLISCTLTSNSAYYSGAGMYNTHSNPVVTNCTFSRNSRGAIFNSHSSPTVSNCTFIWNSWSALYAYGGNPTVRNCRFSGHKTAIFFDCCNESLAVTNCTLTGNERAIGLDCDAIATLSNCIIWGNNLIVSNYDGYLIIKYSCVQGSWPGEGNIEDDPLFVEPGHWEDPCNTPNYTWDDVWIDGDYHLLEDSPCIDAGDPDYIPEPNETDLDGKPRVIGGRIDMGAYESPIFAEARIVPRTINLSNKGKWITCYIWPPEDYDVADIDPNTVLLQDEIKAEQLSVNEQQQVAIARFSREQVQAILSIGQVELSITGLLTDETAFEATDVIRVIDKASRKSAK